MKKLIFAVLVICMLASLFSCGKSETKELTCDGCGKTVEVEADSNMEEDWMIFCESCQESFKDDPVLGEYM